MTTFLEALQAGQRFLFDGSTPTVLYERGVYINRSFDESNLVLPELVLAIHEEFRTGGAQVLGVQGLPEAPISDGVLRFLHASLTKKQVTLDAQLSTYMSGNSKQTGIMVVRPVEVAGR